MATRCRKTDSGQKNGRSMQLRSAADGLATLEAAFNVVAQSNSLDEVKDIRDKAEAVRQYAHNAKASLDLQNKAAELKLRSERCAGELLGSMGLHGGDRRSDKSKTRPSLDELGISQSQSQRWQKEATVPETDFCAFVTSAQNRAHELTTASLLRFATTRLCGAFKWKSMTRLTGVFSR